MDGVSESTASAARAQGGADEVRSADGSQQTDGSGGADADPNDAKGGALLKLALLAAVIAVGVGAAKFTPLGTYLSREGVLNGIELLRGSTWAPLIFIGSYAAATALAVPGTVLTLAGGALFGFWFGTLFNVIGANIGANLAFLLARGLGRDGITKLLGSRLDKLDKATDQHGFQGLLTLRLIPVAPFNALNFGAGLTSISWGSYALATLIGTLPGTAVYTFFGEALLQGSTEASSQAYTRVLIAGLLLVALSLLPRFLKSRGWIKATTVLLAAGAMGTACAPAAEGAAEAGVTAEGAVEAGVTPEAADTIVTEADERPRTPTAVLSSSEDVVDPTPFTELLGDVIDYPRVDYARLADERARLDGYLASLSGVDPADLVGASQESLLAFWINAYNACMLKRVVDRYPIQKAGGLLSGIKNLVADRPENSVWQIEDVFTGDVCSVAGELRSQDDIEHEIIRPLGEPRIHFAVNCAAVSCPPLPTEAFTAARLDEQLDERVQAFVTDENHLQIVDDGGKVVLRLNKVLEWYAEDFGGVDGVRDFLVPYLPIDVQEAVSTAEVQFMEYDWTLNDVPR